MFEGIEYMHYIKEFAKVLIYCGMALAILGFVDMLVLRDFSLIDRIRGFHWKETETEQEDGSIIVKKEQVKIPPVQQRNATIIFIGIFLGLCYIMGNLAG